MLEIKNLWEQLEHELGEPDSYGGHMSIEYRRFSSLVADTSKNFDELRALVEFVMKGGMLQLTGALELDLVNKIKINTVEFWDSRPSEFYKMMGYTPNFHRVIDDDVAKNYSFYALKHSAYCFPWNEDFTGAREAIMGVWRDIKAFMGLDRFAYEGNTPDDGVVDRIQVALYPSGAGELEAHTDPKHNQRLIISGYLSKRGEEYNSGGFFALDSAGQKIDLEDRIELGSFAVMHACVRHGVSAIDPGTDLVNEASGYRTRGRWFLGLYSNDSDAVANRKTAKSVVE